ncbi:MAG TPA: IS1595 family transposase [Allosphingosinicella sp.]|jgi:transposase-like protein
MTSLTAPRFTNEDKAREHLEALRWPEGPYCPHCGSFNATRLQGTKARPGTVQCNDCRQQFTVTVGTVFERSKVPLNKWLLCNHLMVSSKKGISAHQIHRMLGVTYKTAWFMCHRIREAMKQDSGPMGGPGVTVEADETFFGKDKKAPPSRTPIRNMNKIVSLVDRATGRATSFVVTDALNAETVSHILYTNVHRSSTLQTDEANHYKRPGKEFAFHYSVNHRVGEYVRRDDPTVHTNTIEGFFGIFKRGMKGIYQHCGQQHLHRYLAEFDFRYTNRMANGFNDDERASEALKGIAGKRLTYRRISQLAA